ncbi:N-(5'-phosphoribosyl)anthranilate isomerase [Bordetella genomosp. 8]|uniref:N-(5'-phosphoribosyl)anthranilate isomerase n=1 Tax=Bordetella genomosp. 8 TaxID=1416806 RepID=A0A1W6YJ58_9BORD|nr:phosphoribosylanthranilate isomerase [Bordetella genomosp. 8]ARP81090.1 N-(5'-phosphoribosyl)anthranilate isomerase [Bordetella genomosp. 8]
MRTRVKICGMTRPEDIAVAVEAGADAVGLIFYPKSKRYVAVEQAARLRRAVPAFVDVVALFVNAADDDVKRVLDAVGPDLLQFHGDESPEACERFGHRYMKAFRVGGPGAETANELARTCSGYRGAAGWLFDSYSAGYGGSGLAFEHSMLREVQADRSSAPVILSGGLSPDNIHAAVATLRPYAVDVSSGVEASPGIKSAERIHAFVAAVRRADAERAPTAQAPA